MPKKNAPKKLAALRKEKKGEAFEKLFAAIQMAFNPGELVEHNIKLRENSGVNRQIDVSILRRKIIVECKDRSTKVNLAEMAAFINLCESTGSEGIFVSKKGFTKNVVKKAEFSGIKTYTVDKITDQSFLNNFRTPEVNTLKYCTELIKRGFLIDTAYNTPPVELPKFENDKGEEVDFHQLTQHNAMLFAEHYHDRLFAPLVQATLPDGQKNLLDKKHLVKVNMKVEDGALFIRYEGERVPVPYLNMELAYWLSVQPREKEVYLQVDKSNSIVSATTRADLMYKGKPYKVNIVEAGNIEEMHITLTPAFGNSETIKLEVLGELKPTMRIENK